MNVEEANELREVIDKAIRHIDDGGWIVRRFDSSGSVHLAYRGSYRWTVYPDEYYLNRWDPPHTGEIPPIVSIVQNILESTQLNFEPDPDPKVGDLVRILESRWSHHVGTVTEVVEVYKKSVRVRLPSTNWEDPDIWEFDFKYVEIVSEESDPLQPEKIEVSRSEWDIAMKYIQRCEVWLRAGPELDDVLGKLAEFSKQREIFVNSTMEIAKPFAPRPGGKRGSRDGS
jgi:hypothetical protein